MQRTAGNRAVGRLITRHDGAIAAPAAPADAGIRINRWTNLGSWSWDHPIGSGRVSYSLRVGSQAEWNSRLDDGGLDDEDEYRHWMQGFLEAAEDPSWATATSHPSGFRNFRNTVARAPSDAEVMAFMRALYHRGSSLDLAGGGFEMGGVPMYSMRRHLSALIRRYQGRIIQEEAAGGGRMPAKGVKELANQGGAWIRAAMIQNGGATAMKGVDLAATANRMPAGTPGERATKRVALRNAFQTIRNAGQTIRLTIDVHDDVVAYNKAVAQGVFDTVWGTLPGGGTLASTAKSLLKRGFDKMLEEASKSDEPAEQREKMTDEFVQRVNDLVATGDLSPADGNGAINGFETTVR